MTIRPDLSAEIADMASQARKLRQEVEYAGRCSIPLLELAQRLSRAESALKEAEALALELTAVPKR